MKPLLATVMQEKFSLVLSDNEIDELTYYLWLKRYRLAKFELPVQEENKLLSSSEEEPNNTFIPVTETEVFDASEEVD